MTHTCKVEQGSTVAVFGLGGVGLSCIQGARMAGASRILAVDLNSSKFDLARSMGATDCINPATDLPAGVNIQNYIVDITGGGVDYSFEVSECSTAARGPPECGIFRPDG